LRSAHQGLNGCIPPSLLCTNVQDGGIEHALEGKNYEIAALKIRLQEARGRVKELDKGLIESEQRNKSLQANIEKAEREREKAERERERAEREREGGRGRGGRRGTGRGREEREREREQAEREREGGEGSGGGRARPGQGRPERQRRPWGRSGRSWKLPRRSWKLPRRSWKLPGRSWRRQGRGRRAG